MILNLRWTTTAMVASCLILSAGCTQKEPAKPVPPVGKQGTLPASDSGEVKPPGASELAFKGKLEDILKEFETNEKTAREK